MIPRPLIRLSILLIVASLAAACAAMARHEASSRSLRSQLPFGKQFGALTLIGGLEWRSDRPDFGGFSGIELLEDDTFVALTDKGHWAKATLVHDGDGYLTDIDGLKVGRLYAASGKYLQRPYTDSEAITRTPDGAFHISFENRHRISRFDTLTAREEVLDPAPDFSALSVNGSLESLVALPDGRLVALAEDASDWADGFPGWIVDGETITRFSLARDDWFHPTDLALAPDGRTIYLLERRFTLIGGFAMRIRRFDSAALTPGAIIRPETVMEAPGDALSENMEALAATRNARGETILYALSDDNFNAIQRTQMLQFRVEE